MDEENVEQQSQSGEKQEFPAPKMASNSFQTTSFESYKKGGSKGKWLTITLAVLVLLIIAVAVYFLRGGSTVFKSQPSPTPLATSTSTPLSTPKSLVRSEWSFEVLNGTKTAGEAKRIADKLVKLGYKVIKVGNADKNTYINTEFYVQKGLEDKLNLVVSDLKDIIMIASISGELKDSTASARIIIGKNP